MITLVLGALSVFVPMLVEWRRSLRNQRTLRAQGAVEPEGDVHRAMALAYPLAFAAMAAEGVWRGAPPTAWLWAGAAVFALGKAVKDWAIATLGPRWSFRVLILPKAPLVTAGPYRWIRHPNYVGVVGELLGAACWFGATWTGPLGALGFIALMARRVQIEDRLLRGAAPPE